MKKMNWNDIERFPRSTWEVDMSWRYMEDHLMRWVTQEGLDLNPDYQREHVWTMQQRSEYIEYILRGGEVAKTIVFNCPDFVRGARSIFTIVDGKQRLESARMFLRGELPVFGGHTFFDFEGSFDSLIGFKFRVVELRTREDLLKFYLSINTGGTPHSNEEISRVKALLEKEQARK